MRRQQVGSQSQCCTQCKVILHVSYFGTRTRAGETQRMSICRACMRERWRTWNRTKRGDLRGYQKTHRSADPQEVAARVVELASKANPEAEGVRVYRLPSGEWAYWMGAMKEPKGAEFIGLFDFEATPEIVAYELEAA